MSLTSETTQRQDPDLVAVFLAEQGDGAGLDGVGGGHQFCLRRDVLADHGVDLGLDGGQLVLGDRGRMAEVEAGALGVDQLALLGHLRTQHILQCGVQKVGGGVVGAGRRALVGVDRLGDAGAHRQLAGRDLDRQDVQIACVFLDVQHLGRTGRPLKHALVAGLAAAFGVEGRGVEQDFDDVAGLGRLDGRAALHDGQDLARTFDGVIAGEDGRPHPVAHRQPFAGVRRLARALPVFARTLALFGHRGFEAVDIDREAATARLVLGQIQREAIGVGQGEGGLAVQHVAGLEALNRRVEQGHAPAQRGAEADLLLLQRVLDEGLGAGQFGIGVAHFRHQRRDQTVHQRVAGAVLWAQQVGVAHGAAHDAAQDVAPALVRRGDAVGDQEGRRAQVVGDDPVTGGALTLGPGRGGVL